MQPHTVFDYYRSAPYYLFFETYYFSQSQFWQPVLKTTVPLLLPELLAQLYLGQ